MSTYEIVGSGDPPILLHSKSICLSSVAVATFPVDMRGGCGGVNTVNLYTCEWTSAPVPFAFILHSNLPLSLIYEIFLICKS